MTTAIVDDTRQATAIARHWIDGRWRDSAEHQDSINPATSEVIGRFALAGEDEAREATAAALKAFRETAWRRDRALRARVLLDMAQRFEAHSADLTHMVSVETGKVLEYKHILLRPGVVTPGG
jgi:betaine-aldehyde dehydrogenase